MLRDRLAASKVKNKPGGKRRSVVPSAPELKVGYKTAGRETLAAFEQEMTAPSLSTSEAPLIEISEAPAGRATMAAIAEELAQDMRPRQNTLPYADRIANAPGARLPSRAPAVPSKSKRPSEAPEITVSGASEPPVAAPAKAAKAAEDVEIFELLTFIVRGSGVGDLSSEPSRRRFLEQHLHHRLPGGTIESVERIEVTPWTAKGTMVVRVWCRA
jgi:hypothetical protein